MSSKIPADFKYTKDHEWAQIQGDTVTIGITDFAQSALGDIVFVEIPELGKELKQGQTFGVVESIKSVSDLYSPVTGVVVERNSSLESGPENINTAPYESWLVKVKMSNTNEVKTLLSADDYNQFCQTSA